MTILDYFIDPVLRAPTIGSMLMGMASALMGVTVFLRKQSLIGETLSHAAFPGVMIGVLLIGIFWPTFPASEWTSFPILVGAFLTALLGLKAIHLLERVFRVSSDAALCFVLSAFFGIGLGLASDIQSRFSYLYKQAQSYFYGQAATMTDLHIGIYGILTLIILGVILIFFQELKISTFDREYAKSIGISLKRVDRLFFLLTTLAVIIGIRSVGAVLMSAMLIAPAAAARQYTHHLSTLFILAAFFGMVSGFLGNYLSVELSLVFAPSFPGNRLTLPTGPMIVLVMTCICLFSLLFAPKKGVCIRLIQRLRFRNLCLYENMLKEMWRISQTLGKDYAFSLKELKSPHNFSSLTLNYLLSKLVRQGWIEPLPDRKYRLTPIGEKKAAKIVRLHRLWEAYLVNYMGISSLKVHHSAEEMEHILTPELENELSQILNDPKIDPHNQPIPP